MQARALEHAQRPVLVGAAERSSDDKTAANRWAVSVEDRTLNRATCCRTFRSCEKLFGRLGEPL